MLSLIPFLLAYWSSDQFLLIYAGTRPRTCPHPESNLFQESTAYVLLMQNSLISPWDGPLKDFSCSAIHVLPHSNHKPSKDSAEYTVENSSFNAPRPELSPSSIFYKQGLGDLAFPVLSAGAGILASERLSPLSPRESTSAISSLSTASTEPGISKNTATPPESSISNLSKSKKSRERPRIELAPGQPPTTQGRQRARVYVACLQWWIICPSFDEIGVDTVSA